MIGKCSRFFSDDQFNLMPQLLSQVAFFFPPQSVKSEEEIKACWAQVKSDIKVSTITDKTDYVYWILTFKKSEISTKAEFVDGLSVKWIKLADSV